MRKMRQCKTLHLINLRVRINHFLKRNFNLIETILNVFPTNFSEMDKNSFEVEVELFRM
jgi:hypothetical protein